MSQKDWHRTNVIKKLDLPSTGKLKKGKGIILANFHILVNEIFKVHDIPEISGTPYLAMKHCKLSFITYSSGKIIV